VAPLIDEKELHSTVNDQNNLHMLICSVKSTEIIEESHKWNESLSFSHGHPQHSWCWNPKEKSLSKMKGEVTKKGIKPQFIHLSWVLQRVVCLL